MKIYLVGGAVRDELLDFYQRERLGCCRKHTRRNESQKIHSSRKELSCFLHPKTKEEYALARTEIKKGAGYTGFITNTHNKISLEEDLKRRDLTINAIAKDQNGNLIDPYEGIKDLKNRKLRHISDSFIEDPLRVLRVARFHAKLAHLGFTIADKTKTTDECNFKKRRAKHLSSERVWREIEKGLCERSPNIFIQTLYECGALKVLVPELDCCFHKDDNMQNTDKNIGKRTLKALKYAADHNFNTAIRWAICLHGIDNTTRSKTFQIKLLK